MTGIAASAPGPGTRVVDRHVAPAQDALAAVGDQPLDHGLGRERRSSSRGSMQTATA